MIRLRSVTLAAFVLMSAALPAACGAPRILGFGRGRDGVLLVRHTEPGPVEVRAAEAVLGFAEPNTVTCFREVPAGSIRFEARSVAEGNLVRAHTIVLPPGQPLLWDIDHNEVLNGRVHAGLCEDGGARQASRPPILDPSTHTVVR